MVHELHLEAVLILLDSPNQSFFKLSGETDGKRIRTLIADLFPPESYFFSVFGDFNKSRTFIGVEKVISQFLHTCIFSYFDSFQCFCFDFKSGKVNPLAVL